MPNVAFIKGRNKEWQEISDCLTAHDYHTVLWITHDYDKQLDNKCYRHGDAVLAKIPLFLKGKQLACLNKDVLIMLAQYENILFELVNRWCIDTRQKHNHSRDYIHKLASIWLTILKVKKIDHLIFSTTPHRTYDYVAYLVAKISGKGVVIAERTTFNGAGFFFQSIENRSKDLYRNKHNSPVLQANNVISTYRSSYDNAKPHYLIDKEKEKLGRGFLHPQNETLNYKIRIVVDILRRLKKFDFYKEIHGYFRFNKDGSIRASRGYEFSIANLNAIRRVECSIDWYYKNCIKPIVGEKYIYFSPNYQHERTTCPDAGIFHDYFLLLSVLHDSIPGDWKIYIKDHPSSHSQKSINNNRSIEFYKRLLSIGKNIKLISMSEDQFSLIDNSEMVATATGTVALESVSRGKPAIIFGDVWFKLAPGIRYVTSQLECKKAINELREYTFCEIELVKYFDSVFNSLVNLNRKDSISPEKMAELILPLLYD